MLHQKMVPFQFVSLAVVAVATAPSPGLSMEFATNMAHVLETAVVCQRGGERAWYHVSRPRLTMRMFSDAYLEAYLAKHHTLQTARLAAPLPTVPGLLTTQTPGDTPSNF